jgi:ribonuclease-3
MLSGLFPTKPKPVSKAPKVKFPIPKVKFPSERKALLQKFMKGLSINFKHMELLDLAFHHRSFSNERGGGPQNNERLEFLGDSVLGLCTATYLYEALTDKSEGELSKIKSVVVSEQTLAGIALDIGIDRCLVLGNGEEHSGGRTNKSILADAVEAVIGAYFQDSGFVAAD